MKSLKYEKPKNNESNMIIVPFSQVRRARNPTWLLLQQQDSYLSGLWLWALISDELFS